ncbi:MAG TPA: hypothetical protein VKY70_12210 [Pseudomonas sp.]|jgi:hypothetical protein|nr:hypothetical protein [Pseudomonas sp.]
MRLAHFILPAVLGVLLVGCGPDEDERIDTAPPPQTEPMTPAPAEPVPPTTPTPPPTTPSGVPEESDMNTNPAQD